MIRCAGGRIPLQPPLLRVGRACRGRAWSRDTSFVTIIPLAGVAQLVERQLPKRTTADRNGDESNTCDGDPATPASSPDSSGRNPAPDDDLRRLVEAWPTLPDPVRAGILAIVEAVATGSCKGG